MEGLLHFVMVTCESLGIVKNRVLPNRTNIRIQMITHGYHPENMVSCSWIAALLLPQNPARILCSHPHPYFSTCASDIIIYRKVVRTINHKIIYLQPARGHLVPSLAVFLY